MNESEALNTATEYQVEPIGQMDESTWKQIVEIERESFGWGINDESMAETRAAAEHPRGVVVTLKDGDRVVGYVIGYPDSSAAADLAEDDPNMRKEDDSVYVMTLAIVEKDRGIENSKKLLTEFLRVASQKGYTHISAHTPSGRMPLYERLVGAETQHEIEDWCESGEPHTYWIADIS